MFVVPCTYVQLPATVRPCAYLKLPALNILLPSYRTRPSAWRPGVAMRGSRGRFFTCHGNERHVTKALGPRWSLLRHAFHHEEALRHLAQSRRHRPQLLESSCTCGYMGCGSGVRGRAPTRTSAFEPCVTGAIDATFVCYHS